ncbi:hypothetical protein PRZ48_000913 [Zasmidium cellare]|uniref:Heterokaryon incompatibility domain-containing protein n=1 Tax=Zasmidium cellare TaxID=395010 RepID=A0ABR0F0Q8_ZASCE|nr:hypothetical protein PRZ48_000913 [Zasmidium cellare]
MSEADSWNFLRSLWGDQGGAACCQCHGAIEADSAIARTFSVSGTKTNANLPCAKEFQVPAVQRTIRIFHRHLECLYSTTRFVAISHVWEPPIAGLQYKGDKSSASASQVEVLVRQLPAQIAIALEDRLEDQTFEIWHDYISVPQWSPKVKTEIILKIPELFAKANMTIVYLNDVDPGAFGAMRYGTSKEERCRAMGKICNAAWYSRMWTTMEHTQSANMRILAKGFKLIAPDRLNRALIDELRGRWRDEVRAHGNGLHLEQIVKKDKSLVPWELGTINSVRSDALAGKRPSFGVVHAVFSRRRVTVARDFFYAFEGVLKTGFDLGTIDINPKEVMLGMAVGRILSGDLSPLLMIPVHAQKETGYRMDSGYVDHSTWGLSAEEQPNTCTTIRKGSGPHRVVVSVEEVGIFRYARRFDYGHRGPDYTLGALSRMALEASGPDVDAYVDTIGVRLYGQDRAAIHKRLDDGRRARLQEQLHLLYNNFVGPTDVPRTDKIADLIGLSNMSLGEAHEEPLKPIIFLQLHGGTLHHGNAGAIVGIICTKCQGIFLLRILLYQPASSLIGVKAYRIPGLKYRFSHAGGVGILLKDNRPVGRFVWGTPTCDCPKTTEIEVVVDDLPMPNPNNSRYQ